MREHNFAVGLLSRWLNDAGNCEAVAEAVNKAVSGYEIDYRASTEAPKALANEGVGQMFLRGAKTVAATANYYVMSNSAAELKKKYSVITAENVLTCLCDDIVAQSGKVLNPQSSTFLGWMPKAPSIRDSLKQRIITEVIRKFLRTDLASYDKELVANTKNYFNGLLPKDALSMLDMKNADLIYQNISAAQARSDISHACFARPQ